MSSSRLAFGSGARFGFRHHGPGLRDRSGEVVMLRRIDLVDPGCQDGDRRRATLQRPAVRGCVNAAGQPTDDDDTGIGEILRQPVRRSQAVRCRAP